MSNETNTTEIIEKDEDMTATAAPATTDGPTDEDIVNALKEVIDPELGVNIIDLGLVYRIDFDDGGEMQVYMTLTSPGCPAGPQIRTDVKNALSRFDTVDEIKVNFVFSPPWSPDMMSDDAKDELGIMDDF